MFTIEKANHQDINGIVTVHLDAFEDFFLSSLGERFLRLYYRSFIDSKQGIVLCAKVDNEVVGFSACSYVCQGFNKSLVKANLLKYIVESAALLFTKPLALIRLANNMTKESSEARKCAGGGYAELYSIAVSPSCQGKGIGKALLSAIEDDVRKHNNQVSLTTDYYNNEKTIGFYHTLGYDDLYEFTSYPKRKMWRMIKTLDKVE